VGESSCCPITPFGHPSLRRWLFAPLSSPSPLPSLRSNLASRERLRTHLVGTETEGGRGEAVQIHVGQSKPPRWVPTTANPPKVVGERRARQRCLGGTAAWARRRGGCADETVVIRGVQRENYRAGPKDLAKACMRGVSDQIVDHREGEGVER
jgi:hypothetical protein